MDSLTKSPQSDKTPPCPVLHSRRLLFTGLMRLKQWFFFNLYFNPIMKVPLGLLNLTPGTYSNQHKWVMQETTWNRAILWTSCLLEISLTLFECWPSSCWSRNTHAQASLLSKPWFLRSHLHTSLTPPPLPVSRCQATIGNWHLSRDDCGIPFAKFIKPAGCFDTRVSVSTIEKAGLCQSQGLRRDP